MTIPLTHEEFLEMKEAAAFLMMSAMTLVMFWAHASGSATRRGIEFEDWEEFETGLLEEILEQLEGYEGIDEVTEAFHELVGNLLSEAGLTEETFLSARIVAND